MRILNVIASTDPRHGGPQELLRQYCQAGPSLGVRFEVATLDESPDCPISQTGTPVHALGPGWTHWRYAAGASTWLDAHVADFDAVLVHGLHQYHTRAAWRACTRHGVPYFVLPHGMLGPWFRQASPWRHLRKALLWPWQDYPLLRDAAAVIFGCEQEGRDAERTFWPYEANPTVVGFGVAEPADDPQMQTDAFQAAFPALAGRRYFVFLGRLHPVKACDLLIDAFALVARQVPDIDLLMAGADTGPWARALHDRVLALGIESRVHWAGTVRGAVKFGALREAEALVLPSHHENFGMVVAEALACGTPVLLSNGVNIWREVVRAGAGLAAGHDGPGVHRLLHQWLLLDESTRAGMRERAGAVFHRLFDIEQVGPRLIATITPHLRPVLH
jgi:glycosyltransferase involved in cell wall biosynthesis